MTAGRLSIGLRASAGVTDATATDSHTSLGPRGDAFAAGFIAAFCLQFMRDREAWLNHYLRTGQCLRVPAPD